MKIYPLLTAVLITAAYAQTPPAPKPADPSSLAAPSPQHAMPGQLAKLADNDPDRVVATIGTEKITAAEFDSIVNGLPQQYQAQIRGPGKRQFMDQLVLIKVLAKQAVTLHIDQEPGTKQQLEFAKENILAQLAGKAMVEAAKVNDEEAKKYYDEHKSDFQLVSAHHILIRFKGSPVPLKEGQQDMTQEEALAKAQDIEKRLKAGEDFATIAKAESADAGSAANGGDLGTPFKHGQMVKPFEDAAFALPVGQISDPVKTQFGYHIIRVDKSDYKTFEEAKPEIVAKLKPEIARKEMDALKASAGVTLDDNFFGAPPAPPIGAKFPPVNSGSSSAKPSTPPPAQK